MSLSLIIVGCTNGFAQSPSFDCTKSAYPDERTICSSGELSQLDNVLAAGYEYVRSKYGDQYARVLNGPLFKARRACGADAECIKERQSSAIKVFQALGAPTSDLQKAKPEQALWNHNGSTVYLVAQGHSRKFFYKEPRPGVLSAGAKPGSMVFEGEAIGGQYRGIAYVFNSRCGQSPYRVSGPILDNYRRVELRGKAPLIRGNCRIVGYVEDLLEFQLIEPTAPQSVGDLKTAKRLPQSSVPQSKTIDSEREKRPPDEQAAKKQAESTSQTTDPEREKRLADEQAANKKLAEPGEASAQNKSNSTLPKFITKMSVPGCSSRDAYNSMAHATQIHDIGTMQNMFDTKKCVLWPAGTSLQLDETVAGAGYLAIPGITGNVMHVYSDRDAHTYLAPFPPGDADMELFNTLYEMVGDLTRR